MRILCSISGVEYNTQYFPGYLTERESHHPIYDIKQRQLLQYLYKWRNGELTEIDSYLLYTALFNSTGLVIWRTPAKRHAGTKAIVAANMESLGRAIGKINTVSTPKFVIHKIAVTHDTCDLLTSHFWIDNWHQSYHAFSQGYKDEIKHDKIARREQSLDIMLRSPEMALEKFARVLAEWAADVAEFPTHNVVINNQRITLCDYWKSLIMRCVKGDKIFSIPELHLLKLQEFCEEAIDIHGSSYGHALMSLLKTGLQKQKDPFGLNAIDFDIKHPGFKILSHDTTIEDSAKAAMIAAAPKVKPIESDFESKIGYLRAKTKWDMAQEEIRAQEIRELELEQIQDSIENKEIESLEPAEDEDDSDDIEDIDTEDAESKLEDEENING